jgi:hypothetical protein
MSTPKFVSSTLVRMCHHNHTSYALDFSNICTVMSSLPLLVCKYVWLLARSPVDTCFCLLVGVMENWIHNMTERFPKTVAGVPNAQMAFERKKESKICAFIADFLKEYGSMGLSTANISTITFGCMGVFFHLALFQDDVYLYHGFPRYDCF